MRRSSTPCWLLLLALAVCEPAASAALDASLTASLQNSARGRELVFSGTLTNTSPTDKLFLNDIVTDFSGLSATHLALQPIHFFANVPGILLPNESYSNGELFRIQLDALSPAGNFPGSIIFRGGADIIANSDLANVAIEILSPNVTIQASGTEASESGPTPVNVTIQRSAAGGIPLEVQFSLSGSATNGVDYQALAAPATIDTGETEDLLVLTPISNSVPDGPREAVFTLLASSSYNLDSATSASVTVLDKPFDQWRIAAFGASATDSDAAELADPDHDGVKNLMEYLFALNPLIADSNLLPLPVLMNGYLTLTVPEEASDPEIQFIVEGAPTLAGWDEAHVEVDTHPPSPAPGMQRFRYLQSVNAADQAFMRVFIER